MSKNKENIFHVRVENRMRSNQDGKETELKVKLQGKGWRRELVPQGQSWWFNFKSKDRAITISIAPDQYTPNECYCHCQPETNITHSEPVALKNQVNINHWHINLDLVNPAPQAEAPIEGTINVTIGEEERD